jgi:hypothetical protein
LERPDISGFDADGNEVLILEAKFWAALTDNQPLEYLTRLKQNSALIFICPTLRVRPIYDELVRRLKATQNNFTHSHETHSITFDDNKHLAVKTWNEILDTIKHHLVQNNENLLISDIDQIIGFCNIIDSNAFLPLQSDDLSPKYAKRINSYYDLIDKVADELIKRKIVDTLGLKMQPQRCGYTRYLKTIHFGISLNLRFDYWASYADTPFWINFREITLEKGWAVSDKLRKGYKTVSTQFNFVTHETSSREFYFALFPLFEKTEDVVVNDLTDQIISLATNLERQINER